jgi:class 3 adenylate cyclase/predicted ATPase
MQQIADWLKKLGLGQYAERFAENDIDFDILGDLTDQDLKEIGVTSLGHRRKLLRAIANPKGVEQITPAVTVADAPPVTPRVVDTAERRQVSVMFSDLVGSTALSARMDPEDLRELISVYHKCVAGAVRRFGGFVGQYLGDGMLVYFGYPESHEDDAELAVRAGLELIAEVIALKTPAALQTRVGIATGLVVVGDLTGSGEEWKRGIVGETPNLAARLQGIAEPNTVVVAEATRRLLGNLFELKDLGARNLKGIAEPVRAWMALRASTVESRFEALHPSELTGLVGRAKETELLLRCWSGAKSSEGQVALISGEAGIGKSRLTAALLESLAPEPHTRLRYFCSPQHTNSAFYPIIGQMERAAGLLHNDTPQQKLDKLDALLAQTSTSVPDAALIAEMLSLQNDGRYPALKLTPRQRRQKTLEALTGQIETLSRQQPVLMIFEDAHWADPTSLEAFGRVVDRIRTLRVLLLVTLRPDFDAPWVGRPYVTALIINRLAEREAGAMIDGIVGNRLLSVSLRQNIIERTDGVPLFLEEMTKAVLEAGSETAAERTVAAVPAPVPAVPASLHASLMARLDRLGSAREIAQIGSVIGREFSYELIRAVAAAQNKSMLEGSELQSTLKRLADSELVYRRGRPSLPTYVFKHALVRDAAYNMLVRSRREELHTAIARALEEGFPGIVESEPELLAYHYGQAERNPTNLKKALNYLSVARERARSRSALNEAVSHIERALQLIANLPDDESRRRQQLELQIALVGTLQQQKGYAHPVVIAAHAKARELLEGIAEPEMHLAVHYHLFAAHYIAGQSTETLDAANAFLAIAKQEQASNPTVTGHRLIGCRLVGTAHLIRGNIAEATTRLHEALAGYDRIQHAPTSPIGQALRARFVQDIGVTVDSYLSWALWLSGQLGQVAHHADAALAKGRQSGHIHSLFYALWHAGIAYVLLRNSKQVKCLGSELTKLADEHELEYWQALGDFLRGWHATHARQAPTAVALLERGLQRWKNTGAQVFRPILLSFLADAYAIAQRPEDARSNLEEALKVADNTGEKWAMPEIYRLLGDLSVRNNPAAALDQYELAIGLANAQASPSFELRATTSWARLMSNRGSGSKARNRLLRIHERFNEGLDTLDLIDARSLLNTPRSGAQGSSR